MKVPERDVGSTFDQEEIQAIQEVLSSGQSLAWGQARDDFEADFCKYTKAKHAISLSSCTAALDLCAKVLQLGPEDEVVSTTQSFCSTTRALLARGVKIRFADIDAETLNIDPADVKAKVTANTKAIYLVHYGGNPADMDAIRKIADEYNLPVVEDCAHAAGAEYKGRKIGDGDLCCFSFHSLKNMTTLGEGGMLTTTNEKWANEVLKLRTMGVIGQKVGRGADCNRIGPYVKPDFELLDHSTDSWTNDFVRIEEVGTHSRMGSVQAAVGRVQLKKLDGFNADRARIAQRYTKALADIDGIRPMKVEAGNKCAWHLYPCLLQPDSGVDRNTLIKYLQDVHGVQIILRFWPLHLSTEHRSVGHKFGECPVCEKVWFEQQLNLPINPAMEDCQIETVIKAMADGMKKYRK